MASIKETKDGLVIAIKVVPKASVNAIVGWENDALKVRLNAVPEKGEANATLIAYLAKEWGLPKSAISLISGETSRHKRICVQGLSKADLEKKLDSRP